MTKFKFHSVGQGLFYSGKINNFNFIFDIGSLNKTYLQREINSYVKHVLGQHSDVDYVFLSHLDKDHISGLIYLMTKLYKTQNKVKYVVLPYIPIFNSLYLLLRKKGVSVYTINENNLNANSLSQLNKQFQAVWKFSVFYVRPSQVNTNAINTLRHSVTNVNGPLKKVLTKSIYNNLVLSPLWSEDDLEKIQQVFDKLTGKQNRNTASLNLVHGPITKNNPLITKATVLTGDSDWQTNGNIYMSGWLKKQMNSLSDVQTFQVPHHGSINNWNLSLNWAQKHGFANITSVFTTGNYMRWNHPNQHVILSLSNCTKNFEIVDATHDYNYKI